MDQEDPVLVDIDQPLPTPRKMSGQRPAKPMAKLMASRGHPMSERTGWRRRVRAEKHRRQRHTLTLVPVG
jgi:hypothetical protein